jgi:hypothetical protein
MRKKMLRKGKGLGQCHIFSGRPTRFGEMSIGLGVRSLDSADHWSQACVIVSGFRRKLHSLRLSLCQIWTAPGMSRPLSCGVTGTPFISLCYCCLEYSLILLLFSETWHVRNLSEQLWDSSSIWFLATLSCVKARWFLSFQIVRYNSWFMQNLRQLLLKHSLMRNFSGFPLVLYRVQMS